MENVMWFLEDENNNLIEQILLRKMYLLLQF